MADPNARMLCLGHQAEVRMGTEDSRHCIHVSIMKHGDTTPLCVGTLFPCVWGHYSPVCGDTIPLCGGIPFPCVWGHQYCGETSPLCVGTPVPVCGDTSPLCVGAPVLCVRGHQYCGDFSTLCVGTPVPCVGTPFPCCVGTPVTCVYITCRWSTLTLGCRVRMSLNPPSLPTRAPRAFCRHVGSSSTGVWWTSNGLGLLKETKSTCTYVLLARTNHSHIMYTQT